jgi:hypothetical protein
MNDYESRLTFYFRTKRGLNIPLLYEYISSSAQENLVETFILAFNLRSHRFGKGERKLGRYSLLWLFINYPDEFIKVVQLIPYFGRWDDLYDFFPRKLNLDASNIENIRLNFLSQITLEQLQKIQQLQEYIVVFVAKQLYEDRLNMLNGQRTSLCCKWVPTEGGKLDKAYNIFSTIARTMKISCRKLRKEFITPLRSYNRIVEKYICSNNWLNIDYNQVPKIALSKLRNTFEKHDSTRFFIWNYLKNYDPVKYTNLYPHSIISSVRRLNQTTQILENKWNFIAQQIRNQGTLKDCIVVLDTSPSMYNNGYLSFDTAISIALLVSEVNHGPFRNHIINFHQKPIFTVLPEGSDIITKLNIINKMNWNSNWDINKTYELILEHCIENKLKHSEIPKKIIVISDISFDKINSDTKISNKYTLSGYEVPSLIYWNIKNNDHFPVFKREDKTFLSGISTFLLNSLLYGKDLTSKSILDEVLNKTEYTIIRTNLSTV